MPIKKSMHVVPGSDLVERRPEEQRPSRKLASLIDGLVDDGWRALHGVRTGLYTIDHVLVGPPGIFVVQTNGKRGVERAVETDRFLISHTCALSRWVERAAATPVEPLLVFSRATVFPALSRNWGAHVMSTKGLRKHLSGLETKFSADEINATFARLIQGLSLHVNASSRANASALPAERAMVA